MIKKFDTYDNIILIFFILTFFTGSLLERSIFGINVDLFSIAFFLVYFVFFIKWNVEISKKYVFLALSFLFFQMYLCILNDFSLFGLIKQIIPIIIIYTSTYFIISKYGFKKIFRIYEFFVILLCFIGLIQIFLNFFDISIYQKVPWRMNSLIKEPSHFGLIILPIVMKNFLETSKINLKIIILLTSLFWTLSLSVIFFL